MGTFENTVKLNNNSILGSVIEKIKNHVSVDTGNWLEKSLTLSDMVEDGERSLCYFNIQPPAGYRISNIKYDCYFNLTSTPVSQFPFTVVFGPEISLTTTNSIAVINVPTTAIGVGIVGMGEIDYEREKVLGYATWGNSNTPLTSFPASVGTLVSRGGKALNVDGSTTLIVKTSKSNIGNLSANIKYQLEKI